MPDFQFPLTDLRVNRKEGVTIGYVGYGGEKMTTRLSYLGGGITPDPGRVSAFRQACGNASNAGVYYQTEERDTFTAIKNALALDEAYSSGNALVIFLENNNGEILSFEVPAPDASLFAEDDVTLVTPNGSAAAGSPARLAADLVNSAAALINNTFDPPNSFSFSSGVRRSRKVNLPSRGAKEKPNRGEPTGAVLPPAAPN